MALRGPISSALQWRGLRGVTLRSPARPYVGLGPVRTCPMRQATRAICYRSIMSKTPYPPAQSFPVSTKATTLGPQAVSVITPSPSYGSITAVGCRGARERQAQAQRLSRQHQPRRVKGGPPRLRKRTRSPSPARGRSSCDDACSGRGPRRGRRARLGLWRPGLRQREVSGVQHDDFPNAFLPLFVRSATIP